MDTRNRLIDTLQYLHIQMLSDGILRDSKTQQVQYILDMISIYNDGKLDMIEDVIDNIKKFGYSEEHVLPLYIKLLNHITKTDILLDIDLTNGQYNPSKEICDLIGI